MSKEMLINVSEGEECRIALVEDGVLEELYVERTSSTSHVGNIYKGRVTNVEASIQAAFVDFGLGRNGFLHISDLLPHYFGTHNEPKEAVGRKMARHARPPIQKCLRRGDEITVQIIKEGIGTKGPTLTTYLSVPGRILVMMPGMAKNGVSRKIEDEEERRRLRHILDQLKPPTDCGFIIRTAGVGKTKTDIQRDLQYLARLWLNVKKQRESGPAPMELYTEGDLVTRTVRDVFTADVQRLVVDSEPVARKIKDFFKIAMPRTRNKVELYEESVPLFHKYGIEKKIEQMYSRHVPLPSGGSLVIDSTEAVVAIDVNSGKFRDHSDAETTAYKTDMEAADEIPRQLRLRDLGGVIICDFIDLRYERHRRDVEKRLNDNLNNDRAKTKMLRMSSFGIIEMTRQRMRPSLKRSIYFDCPHCKGAGLVKTPESMGLDVMRRLAIAVSDERVLRVDLAVCPEVANVMLNRKRALLVKLETDTGKKINVKADTALGMDEMRLQPFNARDGIVFVEALGPSADTLAPTALRPHGNPAVRDQRARTPDRNQRNQSDAPRDQRPPQPASNQDRDPDQTRNRNDARPKAGRGPARPDARNHDDANSDTRMEMDRAEDEVDRREEMLENDDPIEPEDRGNLRDDAPDDLEDQNDDPTPEVSENVDDHGNPIDQPPLLSNARPDPRANDRANNRSNNRSNNRYENRDNRNNPRNENRANNRNDNRPNNRPANRNAPPPSNRNAPPPTNRNDNRPPTRPNPAPVVRPNTPAPENRSNNGPNNGPDDLPENADRQAPGSGRRRRRRGRGRGRTADEPRNENLPPRTDQGPPTPQHNPESPEDNDDDDRDNDRLNAADFDDENTGGGSTMSEAAQPMDAPQSIHASEEEDDDAEVEISVDEETVVEGDSHAEISHADEDDDEEEEEKPDEEDAPKSRRRGVKARARRRPTTPPSPKSPPHASHPPQPPAPVVRTGSTDRHLVDDEPLEPPPITRPRTYRDLDQIPDDLD